MSGVEYDADGNSRMRIWDQETSCKWKNGTAWTMMKQKKPDIIREGSRLRFDD